MRRVAPVPKEFEKQGIRWVVIESDAEESGGVFIFLHSSLDQPCEFDDWYETMEIAETEALRGWGVGPNSWRSE